LEFKSQVGSFGADICAFANTNGGVIIFGVKDDGQLVGVQGHEEDISSVAEECEPPLRPDVKQFQVNGKNVLVATIKQSMNLHSLSGKVYRRVGSTNRPLSGSEILKEGQKLNKINFGKQACKEATLEDISKEKLEWFLRKANSERNRGIDSNLPVNEALNKLDLLKGDQLTNAAVLIFGKRPQKFFLQAEIRCARFKGRKIANEFIDMKVFQGTLSEQIDRAGHFVMQHIEKSAKTIPGQVAREEKWEYPLEAVREAITNAVAHRDYFTTGNVQVRIFDDRLEVWNSGSLPEGMTIEDLKGKHKSRPQNPSLARLLFLIGYIEQWGSGTNKMIELCDQSGLPEPKFEEEAGNFVVTFQKSKLTEGRLEQSDLNDRQKKAIKYLQEHKKITSGSYQELNNTSARTARRDLSNLVEKELLERRGKGQSIHYILKE